MALDTYNTTMNVQVVYMDLVVYYYMVTFNTHTDRNTLWNLKHLLYIKPKCIPKS